MYLPMCIACYPDTTDRILHREHPAAEPSLHQRATMFDSRFGIVFEDECKTKHVRKITSHEYLLCYSISVPMPQYHVIAMMADHKIDKLLCGAIPWSLAHTIASNSYRISHLYDKRCFENCDDTKITPCYLQTSSPTTILDWDKAYNEDNDISAINSILRYHKPNAIPDKCITSIHAGCQVHLRNGMIARVGNKLLLFKLINMDTQCVGLIIVPISLRRTLFDHYHAGPSGGHVGFYKTLYRMRMRFFWPGMREDMRT